MEKVHSLPGSTGSSSKGRKARKPEAEVALTLPEFEQWLMYEIGQTYDHSAHRGLSGATPYSAWSTLSEASKPQLLPDSAAEELRSLIQFLPMSRRTIQADGLTLFYLHYWYPIFTAWRAANRRAVVRYHPEVLSRIFVSADGKEYVEASFADLRRRRISLWKQQAVLKHLRSQGKSHVTESAIFNAIAAQRSIVEGATAKRRSADRRGRAGQTSPFPASGPVQSAGEIPRCVIANAGCRLQQAGSHLSRRATVNRQWVLRCRVCPADRFANEQSFCALRDASMAGVGSLPGSPGGIRAHSSFATAIKSGETRSKLSRPFWRRAEV